MHDRPHQTDVPAPASRLGVALAFWGGPVAVLSLTVAAMRGEMGSSAMAVLTVAVATAAGFGVLAALSPRPLARWAMPLLGAQMARTMLAPALGLGVALVGGVHAVAFWMTLLAVTAAMLAGETVAIAGLLGRSALGRGAAGGFRPPEVAA